MTIVDQCIELFAQGHRETRDPDEYAKLNVALLGRFGEICRGYKRLLVVYHDGTLYEAQLLEPDLVKPPQSHRQKDQPPENCLTDLDR